MRSNLAKSAVNPQEINVNRCLASLKCIDILESALKYLKIDSKCQNGVSRLLRSLLLCPLVHFEWTIEVLVGFHLMEPFLAIMLDLHPRVNHHQLRTIFQNLFKQMMNPVEGLSFASVDQHALPALSDGFFKEYKKTEWIPLKSILHNMICKSWKMRFKPS